MFETSPLSHSFMLACMLGIIVFGVKTFSGTMDQTWGFTMLILFSIGFIASVVSITPPKYPDFRKGKFKAE